jgi:hypothetical protein
MKSQFAMKTGSMYGPENRVDCGFAGRMPPSTRKDGSKVPMPKKLGRALLQGRMSRYRENFPQGSGDTCEDVREAIWSIPGMI